MKSFKQFSQLDEAKAEKVTHHVYAPKEKDHYVQTVHHVTDDIEDAKKKAAELMKSHPVHHVSVESRAKSKTQVHSIDTKTNKWRVRKA